MGNQVEISIQVDSSRLHRARGLFISSGSDDILVNSLEGLGVELGNQVAAFGNIQDHTSPMHQYVAHIGILHGAIRYVSDRLTEVMIRHQQIAWMRQVLAYETQPDVFAQASDPKAMSYRMFMGLVIKDFHIDIASLMDALAPVVIQAGKLASKGKTKLPDWADIDGTNSSKYREQLAKDLRDIVDKTARWWPGIRRVRNFVTHREHDRIIFGDSKDGLLFQIYDSSRSPMILPLQVLHPNSHNVVDFDLYSAFVFAEIVTLLDDLGIAIAPKLNISQISIAQRQIRVVEKSLAQSIERLAQLIG